MPNIHGTWEFEYKVMMANYSRPSKGTSKPWTLPHRQHCRVPDFLRLWEQIWELERCSSASNVLNIHRIEAAEEDPVTIKRYDCSTLSFISTFGRTERQPKAKITDEYSCFQITTRSRLELRRIRLQLEYAYNSNTITTRIRLQLEYDDYNSNALAHSYTHRSVTLVDE